jgi:hypothetical protein
MRDIYAVQTWTEDEVWRTIYLSTFLPDAEATYANAQEVTAKPVRLVTFRSTNLDFVAIYARDFAVLDVRS